MVRLDRKWAGDATTRENLGKGLGQAELGKGRQLVFSPPCPGAVVSGDLPRCEPGTGLGRSAEEAIRPGEKKPMITVERLSLASRTVRQCQVNRFGRLHMRPDHHPKNLVLGSRYSWTPSGPDSRPRPDCFTPPKGASGCEIPVVDPDHPELQLFAHLEGGRQVSGVDVGGQAVVGGIGESDHIVDIVEGDHRHHRAEDLLLVHRAPWLDVGEHGRLVEVAGTVRTIASGEHRGALLDARRHQFYDPIPLHRIDQRTDGGSRSSPLPTTCCSAVATALSLNSSTTESWT